MVARGGVAARGRGRGQPQSMIVPEGNSANIPIAVIILLLKCCASVEYLGINTKLRNRHA